MADEQITTKACSRCKRELPHIAFAKASKNKKHGLQAACKECKQAFCNANRAHYLLKKKQWREANREHVKKTLREHYIKNREDRLCKSRAHREQNRERYLAQGKAYYAAHKDEWQEYGKARYEANREEILLYNKKRYENNKDLWRAWGKKRRETKGPEIAEYRRRYYQENKDRLRPSYKAALARRKSRLAAAPGDFTRVEWLAKCDYFGWHCYLCYTPVTPETVHLEHRKPIVRGGSNWLSNIAPACARCNLSKNRKTEAEFRAWLKD